MQIKTELPEGTSLQLPQAYGGPLYRGRLRQTADDFHVSEQLGWEPCGDGEHDYLWLRKTDVNTAWLAKQLADFAGVAPHDVGYAGLKDRHAVTEQWFSVPRWHKPLWSSFAVPGVEILNVDRHLRKLRRGAHQSNRFCIRLRSVEPLSGHLWSERLDRIRNEGVPNYFGEQRFGRGGANIGLANAWAAGRRLSRDKRSLAISTVRAFCFNAVLADRVQAGTWHQLSVGDLANLDGSGSVFTVSAIDDELTSRCQTLDIHPAIALVGADSEGVPEHWRAALGRARVEPGSRSLRMRARELSAQLSGDTLQLTFVLQRGCYATSLLRELCEWHSAPGA